MSAEGPAPRPTERCRAGFARVFGVQPRSLAFAPGRVNLIGDHTDHAGGLALPIAIEMGCAAAIGAGPGSGRVRAAALDLGESADAPLDPRELDAAAPGLPAWARYSVGAAALGAERLGLPTTRLDLHLAFTSTVPMGAGLSSSAAVEVACVSAVESLAGASLDPMDKAKIARAAEHRYAGVPCGLLDQLASVFARAGHALRLDFASGAVEPVALPDGSAWVLLDSAVSRSNASGVYAARLDACERARAALGVEHLGRADEGLLRAHRDRLPPDAYGAARHVVTECARVDAFIGALRSGDLALAGRLMLESHRSLAGDFRVSHPAVDALVDLAAGTPGVLGCRMTGAGCGGFVVALVEQAAVDRTVRELRAGTAGVLARAAEPIVTRAGDGCRAETLA